MVTWHRTSTLVAAAILSLVPVAACSEDRDRDRRPDESVDEAVLITAVNEQLGLDPDIDNLRALLVYVDGEPVLENYYDWPTDARWDVSSITNTILGMLVGIALADGDLPGLEATLAELLPEHRADMSRQVSRATLRDLLTMSAGFAGVDRDRTREYMTDPDPVGRILRAAPDRLGGGFEYSNQAAHLLSAVLARATGRSLLDYAEARIFDPLGIDTSEAAGFEWPVDRGDLHLGWGGLRLSPADLVRIGQLFLDGGEWQGEQVVPADWVREATQEQVRTRRQTNREEAGDAYGYGWWLTETDGESAYFAYGSGGQLIEVVPSRSLVVVVANEIEYDGPGGAGFSSHGLTFLVDDVIAPAVAP
jgi:CubicO group peptidase (beta-lactamase class C family)